MRSLRVRVAIAALLSSLPFMTPLACGPSTTPAAVNKPMGPADGAGDYKDNPAGPAGPAIVPTVGGEPNASSSASSAIDEGCPPKCNPAGNWVGCHLTKPKGTGCTGCAPRCKLKGSQDAGWYDCSNVLIVLDKCG